ncbi:hypothetical protein QE152_g30998 [Popillia japonica]|uniref:Uncharacterized protein n=1 Tax=Popillia japonica TaxID=7064 RepID=A0AAW1JCS5_POPJA
MLLFQNYLVLLILILIQIISVIAAPYPIKSNASDPIDTADSRIQFRALAAPCETGWTWINGLYVQVWKGDKLKYGNRRMQ